MATISTASTCTKADSGIRSQRHLLQPSRNTTRNPEAYTIHLRLSFTAHDGRPPPPAAAAWWSPVFPWCDVRLESRARKDSTWSQLEGFTCPPCPVRLRSRPFALWKTSPRSPVDFDSAIKCGFRCVFKDNYANSLVCP